MPPRMKEEDKIERIIRSFLKQPENRRCINCNNLGPQYVCTTFWTFICTNCSGVHREFTHRVKSVSMSKFNPEEVEAIQAGGNERARQIYLKTWDPQRNFYPDSSNLQRIREFIRNVYVERRYTGGNRHEQLSMVKTGQRNDTFEPRSSEISSCGIRDDNLERRSCDRVAKKGIGDCYERRSFGKSSTAARFDDKNSRSFGGRSARNMPENASSGSRRSGPARFEIVDDRFRDDGNVKCYDRYGGKERQVERSLSSQKSGERSLPVICPVKDILGENVPPLTIRELPKANDMKKPDAVNHDSTDGNRQQFKTIDHSSLIDFNSNSEPQAELKELNSNVRHETKPAENTKGAPQFNTLESLLFGLSAPAISPSADGLQNPVVSPLAVSSQNPADAGIASQDPVISHSSVGSQNPGDAETSSCENRESINSFVGTDDGTRNPVEVSNSVETLSAPNINKDQTFDSSSNAGTDQAVELHNQKDSSSTSNDIQPASSVTLDQSSQLANKAGDVLMPKQRMELPEDLFASNLNDFTSAIPGWQMNVPHGMNYGMQFQSPAMPTDTFPNPVKPSNPFDIGNDRPQVQAATFPSMSTMQGSLPNTQSVAFLQMPPAPYATNLPSCADLYGGMNNPEAYARHQSNTSLVPSGQGSMAVGIGNAFESLNPIRQANREDSFSTAPKQSTSQGVNPFG